MDNYDVIIIGSGLAGLTAAYELSEKDKKVLIIEKEKFLGGRTASWDENGMIVESGFHRHIGYYKELPKLLNKVGVKINNIVMWEKQIDIMILKNNAKLTLGIDPFLGPIKFLKGIVGNDHVLSINDKLSILRFFASGMRDYVRNPKNLDKYSVTDYSKKYKVTTPAFNYVVTSLSTGIFFLPPEEYSAKVFFGLFAPSVPRFHKMRIGAYLGGMSDIMANPIANRIKENGGEIMLNSEVVKLIRRNNQIIGVELKNGDKIHATNVILAADLANAKKLLKPLVSKEIWIKPIIKLSTMSALTIQFDLNSPCLVNDRTKFAPETMMTSFAEQSRTTFKHVQGRLSVIISNPKKYIDLEDDKIYKLILEEASKLRIPLETKISDYRVIRERDKFYRLGPNNDSLRPVQATPLKGLTLAGDYTRQPFYSTMEGAVISGKKAAQILEDE